MLTQSLQTKVLLFGQSSGATNVFQVAALPQAPSLIKAAIMESGGGRDALTNATIQSLGSTYAKYIGCDVTNVRASSLSTDATDHLR